jgi:HDOD domain
MSMDRGRRLRVVAHIVRSGKVMFNPQAPSSEVSTRSLLLRQALAAAFKARRQNLPPPPASLPALLAACRSGVQGILAKPGCRDALGEIRARLFHAPGRDAEAQAWWHESVATAVFASRVAQLEQASVCASFLGGLLHRSGEALALKMLARVELEYRIKLDSASRREWCATHSQELTERLIRTWNLAPEIGSCVLGWMRFAEVSEVSRESAAVYFGRLFAIELLQPQFCVPGALDHAAADLGLGADVVAKVRQEDARALIRALD